MSEPARRKLLVGLITKGVMPAESIIRDIEKAISIFEKNESFFEATKKWQSDLVFVNEYCKQRPLINGKLKAHSQNVGF